MITALLLAATPTPTPTPSTPPEELVTPGVPGFLALFVLGVAVILLGTSMVRRVRRVDYVGRRREQESTAAAPPAPGTTPGDAPPATPPAPPAAPPAAPPGDAPPAR